MIASSPCPTPHLNRLQKFVVHGANDDLVYAKPFKSKAPDQIAKKKCRRREGELVLSAHAPDALSPRTKEKTDQQRQAALRRKALSFGHFLNDVITDIRNTQAPEAGKTILALQRLATLNPDRPPTRQELRACLQMLGPGPADCGTEPAAVQASSRPSPLSDHFLGRLKNRGVRDLSPTEAAWVHVLGQALDQPTAELELTGLHMPVLDTNSRIIQLIIPNFVALRRHLRPALKQVVLPPDTNEDLARHLVRPAPDTPEEAQFIATLRRPPVATVPPSDIGEVLPTDVNPPPLHWDPQLYQPDAHGVLDWSSMDAATFEGLDAKGALSAFIRAQTTAIALMIMPPNLTKQPSFLNECHQLKTLRFPKPAMGALYLRDVKGLTRVELLEAREATLNERTKVPFGCTVSHHVKRQKPLAAPLPTALSPALAADPAPPSAEKPRQAAAELFKRKARVLIPSTHRDRSQLLLLIDSLGDYLDAPTDTLSLERWAPTLVDEFARLGGMSAFALSCDKAKRWPKRLRTPADLESLPPYVARLKPAALEFPRPDASHMNLRALAGLQQLTLIDPVDADLAENIELPPGCQLVVRSGDA